jgi:hypothetical protein
MVMSEVKWLALLLRFWKVPGSNLDQIPGILTELYWNCNWFLRPNTGVVPYNRTRPLPIVFFICIPAFIIIVLLDDISTVQINKSLSKNSRVNIKGLITLAIPTELP